MPRFSFKVVDKDGRTRGGALSAMDRDDAQRILQAKGLKVLGLSEEANRLGVATAEVRFRPGLWERMARFRPESPLFLGVILLSALIGVLLFASEWRSPGSRARLAAAAAAPREVHLRCQGEVHMRGAEDLGDVWLAVQFPEVPFQKDFRWSELDHPGAANRYSAEVSLKFPVAPTRFRVRVLKPGYRDALSPQMPLGSGPSVAVPELLLVKLAKYMPAPLP